MIPIPLSLKNLALSFILLLVSVLGAVYFLQTQKVNQIACTQEAKQCPDGSYISRTGPNCEFAQCPSENLKENINTSNWKTYHNEKYGFEVRYPDIFVPIDITGKADDAYQFTTDMQNIEFVKQKEVNTWREREFPQPDFEILIAKDFSIDQWIDEVIGCEEEVTGYKDACVQDEGWKEEKVGDSIFTVFHEPGPIDGAYHHVAKKDHRILDVITFHSPKEDSFEAFILKGISIF